MRKKKVKMLKNSELNIFCEQINMILKSGISVYEGICILLDEATSNFEKNIYKSVITLLESGETFPEALKNSGYFPQYMTEMIVIGEASGRLDIVLERLGTYYKKEQFLKDEIRHAVVYPFVMMILMVAVIFVLAVKVLPIFNTVFSDLGTELSGVSKIAMDLGRGFFSFLGIFLVVVFFIILLLFAFSRTKLFGKKIKNIKEKLFVTKKIAVKTATSRFLAGMSLMLASGLDIHQSLEMVYPLVDNKIVMKKIDEIRNLITQGKNFSEAISEAEIFNKTYSRMVSIGYRSGLTDEVIENISQRYDDEIESNLARLIAIIEPSLVAFLSIIVGVLLLSVMLPLLGIMSAI